MVPTCDLDLHALRWGLDRILTRTIMSSTLRVMKFYDGRRRRGDSSFYHARRMKDVKQLMYYQL